MKTPIAYYGGKQQLAETILKLIPPHRVYVEPFIGGAAVFFAKEPSDVEIINDINGEIVNFYDVLKRDYSALQSEIDISLHSRRLHQHARVIYKNPDMFDSVKRAWAFWMLANTSFCSKVNGIFACDNVGKATRLLKKKRDFFTDRLSARVQNVQIECCDALKIIRNADTQETFFYLDPPYPETEQAHYNGYSSDDFRSLLAAISRIEGKFLLSSFRHDALAEYKEQNVWSQVEIHMKFPMAGINRRFKQKVEVLTANYSLDKISCDQQSLF